MIRISDVIIVSAIEREDGHRVSIVSFESKQEFICERYVDFLLVNAETVPHSYEVALRARFADSELRDVIFTAQNTIGQDHCRLILLSISNLQPGRPRRPQMPTHVDHRGAGMSTSAAWDSQTNLLLVQLIYKYGDPFTTPGTDTAAIAAVFDQIAHQLTTHSLVRPSRRKFTGTVPPVLIPAC